MPRPPGTWDCLFCRRRYFEFTDDIRLHVSLGRASSGHPSHSMRASPRLSNICRDPKAGLPRVTLAIVTRMLVSTLYPPLPIDIGNAMALPFNLPKGLSEQG